MASRTAGRPGAFTEAINHTIENGIYQQVLDRRNLASEAVSQSELNPPALPKPTS